MIKKVTLPIIACEFLIGSIQEAMFMIMIKPTLQMVGGLIFLTLFKVVLVVSMAFLILATTEDEEKTYKLVLLISTVMDVMFISILLMYLWLR